jgi:hypothetical protein
MNTDKVYGMAARDPDAMRQAMYLVLSRLQDAPELQLQATALCLYAMCKATGTDMRKLLNTVERMAEDLDGPFNSTFRALEAYAREQIGRR